LNDLQPAALGLGKRETDFLVFAGGWFNFLHALNLLELALGLGGLGVLGAEAVHEIHQVRDFALLVFIRGNQLFLRRGALGEVVLVIAAVADEL